VIGQVLAALLIAAEDGDSPLWLLLLGPAGAAGVYYGLWHYYRNATKSHSFETETRVEAQPITGTDRKVNEVKGTQRTSIEGDNRDDHRRRVQRIP
jgi:hypothetical protein